MGGNIYILFFIFFFTALEEVGYENMYIQMKAIFDIPKHYSDFNNLSKSVIINIITIAS